MTHTEEVLERARTRSAARTPEERARIYDLLVKGTHVIMCAPRFASTRNPDRSFFGDPGPIGGPDCICGGVPMPYRGPNGLEDVRTGTVLASS